MTSLDRKSRSVNASKDIASQFQLKEKKSLKTLKSKNSQLLAKYREKLRGNKSKDEHSDHTQDIDENLTDSDTNLIPKVSSESFRGVVFDDENDKPDVNKSRKRNNNRKSSGQGKDKKKSRFRKFKSFKRSKKGNNNKPKQESK